MTGTVLDAFVGGAILVSVLAYSVMMVLVFRKAGFGGGLQSTAFVPIVLMLLSLLLMAFSTGSHLTSLLPFIVVGGWFLGVCLPPLLLVVKRWPVLYSDASEVFR